jgi:anti-sigma regulatory factor (Ser/Thr protein kinase)
MEGLSTDVMVTLSDTTGAGEARRASMSLARAAGFDETRVGQVALIATEAASNVVKHGGGGHFLASVRDDRLHLWAVDKGPGMSDVNACVADGFSTTGTPGKGLGAIVRIADRYDVSTLPGKGTVVWAELARQAPDPRRREVRPELELAGLSIPVAGEARCGDGWAYYQDTVGGALVAMTDGLGHGAAAGDASLAAIGVLTTHADRQLPEILSAMHGQLRSTRGAAISLARIDRARRELHYAGVGNIAATLYTPSGHRGLVSQNGTVGHAMPSRIAEQVEPWPDDALLVLHSDGLTPRWTLDTMPQPWSRPPATIAATLWRDASRGRDDATVVVVRDRRAGAP